MCFCCFYGFIRDTQRYTNFKHEESRVCKGSFFSIFLNLSFTAAKKQVF